MKFYFIIIQFFLFYNNFLVLLLNFFRVVCLLYLIKKSISALQPDLRSQAQYYSTLVNGGILTPDEAREGLGLSAMNSSETNCIRVPQKYNWKCDRPHARWASKNRRSRNNS